MCLRIHDPVIDRNDGVVIREEEKEIFERLSQEEALHLVPVVGVGGVHDIVNGGVSPSIQSCVLVERLQRFYEKMITTELRTWLTATQYYGETCLQEHCTLLAWIRAIYYLRLLI